MDKKDETGIILIVDDTPANLSLLSRLLTSEGYSVRPAPSGHLALQAAKTDPPDLILLDIKMPEMDGFEVCRKLKEDETLSLIPVLFISALTDSEDKIKAFKAGGLDYITKPFQADEVIARVATHLSNRRYQLELKEKNKTLQKTLDELRAAQRKLIQSEKMASLGVLTAGIAHEINNPINYIKASVNALGQDMVDIKRLIDSYGDCHLTCESCVHKDQITKIKSEIEYPVLIGELESLVKNITLGADRTEEIVNSLRTYARLDEKKKTPVYLNELMDNVLVLLQNRHKKKITIHKAYGEPIKIPVQSGRLLQVFNNVIDNAIDAVLKERQTPPPTITITMAHLTYNGIQCFGVHVQDNGSGIKKDVIEKIFDPFFTTKEIGKGMGLGMSISYGIIHDHNGHIDITSEVGKGTRVSIILPIEEVQR